MCIYSHLSIYTYLYIIFLLFIYPSICLYLSTYSYLSIYLSLRHLFIHVKHPRPFEYNTLLPYRCIVHAKSPSLPPSPRPPSPLPPHHHHPLPPLFPFTLSSLSSPSFSSSFHILPPLNTTPTLLIYSPKPPTYIRPLFLPSIIYFPTPTPPPPRSASISDIKHTTTYCLIIFFFPKFIHQKM